MVSPTRGPSFPFPPFSLIPSAHLVTSRASDNVASLKSDGESWGNGGIPGPALIAPLLLLLQLFWRPPGIKVTCGHSVPCPALPLLCGLRLLLPAPPLSSSCPRSSPTLSSFSPHSLSILLVPLAQLLTVFLAVLWMEGPGQEAIPP